MSLEYLEYLKSDHWKKLRAEALFRDRGLCRKCGSGVSVQVHHERYRTPWTACTLEDVICVCPACHQEAHGLGRFVFTDRLEFVPLNPVNKQIKKKDDGWKKKLKKEKKRKREEKRRRLLRW